MLKYIHDIKIGSNIECVNNSHAAVVKDIYKDVDKVPKQTEGDVGAIQCFDSKTKL